MKSNSDKSLPPLTVPPIGEPQLEGHGALTSPSLSTSTSSTIRLPKSRISSHPQSHTGVKRAASSSNMQQGDPSGPSDASAASLADKKRNKLGYHRTSVACGHCRRRKIRCLVAPEDPQGRCANCIRLKKECVFYPVDQQPANERQRRPPVRESSQASSSPAPQHAGPSDQLSQYPPPQMQMGYPPPLGSMQMGEFERRAEDQGFAKMLSAPIETSAYTTPLRSATWDPTYMESPMSAGGQISEVGTPGYWKSPVTGDYPSYGSQPESARSAHFPGSYTSARQDSWASGMPPSQSSTPVHPLASSQTPIQAHQQRSMSLQQDSSGGIYGTQSQISESPYYDTRGPPSLYASTGSPATSVSLSDGTSAPGQTQLATMNYGPHGQAWDPSKAGMEFGAPGGWYPEPGNMAHGPDGQQGWSHHTGGYKQE